MKELTLLLRTINDLVKKRRAFVKPDINYYGMEEKALEESLRSKRAEFVALSAKLVANGTKISEIDRIAKNLKY